ncbi:MAG: tetratricopeptide repeat protein [Candidatus Omnitrophica bacterium]|nr:tetratricopeptide repeat protein [Candidatus Omnitrophota bacterium]
MKKILFFLFIFFYIPVVLAASVDAYLIEIGEQFLNQGRWQKAKIEFEKALQVNPTNTKAKRYLRELRQREIERTLNQYSDIEPIPIKQSQYVDNKTYQQSFDAEPRYLDKDLPKDEGKADENKFAVSGEAIAAFGFTPEDFIWKRANWDLNELDWRMRDTTAFNNKENTYDPAIYDRLRLILDTNQEEGFDFYTNFTVDPWSFIGKTNKVTVTGSAGDRADVQYFYWSNTGYTVNQSIFTRGDGDAISLPELKVQDYMVPATTVTDTFSETFDVPELEVHNYFWPLREMWVDYKKPSFNIRVFPLGFQDQALTSSDPLRLSNNHIYWEDSPWLDRWEPGIVTDSNQFIQGGFDDELSWFTRNSEGQRLTFLRGISLTMNPDEVTDISATIASSKTLWQDYDSFDTWSGAIEARRLLSDRFAIGFINTIKLGLDKNNLDAQNFVWGTDFYFSPFAGSSLQLEVATSRSKTDKTTDFELEERGNAFQLGFVATNLYDDILTQSYDQIWPGKKEAKPAFFKIRLLLTHMDEAFDPGLSTYLETRKDQFWGRHLHFGEPFQSYYSGLYKPSLTWEDIRSYRIGDSISPGRDVVGFRFDSRNYFDGKLDTLFDVRNAHDVDGKYLETIARLENTYRITDKFTTKILGIYHDLPDTTGGIDPYDTNADTGEFLDNTAIEDGKDADITTLSLGGQYDFTNWFSAWGIWEYTNDYTVAYDDFPRGILNDSTFTTNTLYGKTYREQTTFLYSQGLFPLPPYEHYNIFKIGLKFDLGKKWNLNLDYTRNEYESAGQIDNNINHAGIEVEYLPIENLGLYFSYVWSRWNDLDRMADGEGVFFEDHHNFFTEARWLVSESDSLILQYGVSGRGVLSEFLYDPYGGTLSTLDTQHIFRVYYRKQF